MNEADELLIDSATGVAVALPVAGPGGRAYAFVLDWHIRLALALAWYGSGALLHSTLVGGAASLAVPFDPGPAWFLAVVLPATAIYFLYHPVLEVALRGRTPGKRFAGVRIVTRAGSAPGTGALLVRNVFRLIDSFPGLYCVGLVATIVTRQSVRLGDLAAGTVLVYERDRALSLPRSLASLPRLAGAESVSALASGELVAELQSRWQDLSAEARASLAGALLRRLGEPEAALAGADDAALQRLLAIHGAGGRRDGAGAGTAGLGSARAAATEGSP
jgi:uncharacterized RDD family membrane protein YckC